MAMKKAIPRMIFLFARAHMLMTRRRVGIGAGELWHEDHIWRLSRQIPKCQRKTWHWHGKTISSFNRSSFDLFRTSGISFVGLLRSGSGDSIDTFYLPLRNQNLLEQLDNLYRKEFHGFCHFGNIAFN